MTQWPPPKATYASQTEAQRGRTTAENVSRNSPPRLAAAPRVGAAGGNFVADRKRERLAPRR
ncbi:hypothetical protein ES703_89165 [subsurface metagenome]